VTETIWPMPELIDAQQLVEKARPTVSTWWGLDGLLAG